MLIKVYADTPDSAAPQGDPEQRLLSVELAERLEDHLRTTVTA